MTCNDSQQKGIIQYILSPDSVTQILAKFLLFKKDYCLYNMCRRKATGIITKNNIFCFNLLLQMCISFVESDQQDLNVLRGRKVFAYQVNGGN